MTQHQKIINYTKRKSTITPYEAFLSLRITKLATRIGEIERDGLAKFDHIRTTSVNAEGEKSVFMTYKLLWVKEDEDADDKG